LEVLGVSGSPGTPVQYTLEDVENTRRIRIGDPDQTITGQRDYRIVYRVEGAHNGFPDHDELYWNALGTDWEVPIEQASVTVTAPAAISRMPAMPGPSAPPGRAPPARRTVGQAPSPPPAWTRTRA
jgi:Predicted membrane protein (DUF2207)